MNHDSGIFSYIATFIFVEKVYKTMQRNEEM